jgi:predicted phage baseplate assembly protein
MLVADPLCRLPDEPADDCCNGSERLAAPIPPLNARGLPSIRYRIGTFTSFRRAMLRDVADKALLDDLLEPGRSDPNPFATWRDGNADDYQTGFIELWAYLADILTFYQERIAHEAFLGTLTQRESAVRLAELIGHRPGPGAAAHALVALTVEGDRVVDLPVGLRVGAKPGPGGPPPVFELAAAATAFGKHSAIPLSSLAPTNQFAALASYGTIAGIGAFDEIGLANAAAEIYGAAGTKYLKAISAANVAVLGGASAQAGASAGGSGGGAGSATSPATAGAAGSGRSVARSAATAAGSGVVNNMAEWALVGDALRDAVALKSGRAAIERLVSSTGASTARRRIVLAGLSTRLRVGDDLLVVQNEGRPATATALRRVVTVDEDSKAKTTTIAWDEPPGTTYQNVLLYALRAKAATFGSKAAPYVTLSTALTDKRPPPITQPPTTTLLAALYPDNWDDTANAKAFLPTGSVIDLDSTYDEIAASPSQPSWVVLIPGGSSAATRPAGLQAADGRSFLALRATDAAPVTQVDYAMSLKVTRLTVSGSVPVSTFPIRSTVVLASAERLVVQPILPLPERVTGTTILLDGLYPDLRAGQIVVVSGRVYDPATGGPGVRSIADAGVLAGPPELDRSNALTQVTLKKAPVESYARSTTKLLANVVEATHGETVRDEVLGSGDGSASQVYPLKKAPLTYLASTGGEGLAATTTTLRVTVNGVSWEERSTLRGTAPDDEVYVTREDETTGKTSVTFGDGAEGTRPPTGRDNVRARYRRGLGTVGNVGTGSLSQLIDNVAGLQRATNPTRASGGVDPETAAQLKASAPTGVRTFGRAVSTDDYAALALSYPGIAKASAVWVRRDVRTFRAIEHPWLQLTVAAADGLPPDGQLRTALRRFLDARRDPNVPLRIETFAPVFVEVAATVDIETRYPRQGTMARVRAAVQPAVGPDGLAGFLAFDRLDFGSSLHQSAILAAIQNVAGVRSARLDMLRRVGPTLPDPSGTVRETIFVRPNEIPVIRDDAEDPTQGRLVLTLGEGGFADT